jgi:XRE family transcriptional regulator, regulator of sulfur utilization
MSLPNSSRRASNARSLASAAGSMADESPCPCWGCSEPVGSIDAPIAMTWIIPLCHFEASIGRNAAPTDRKQKNAIVHRGRSFYYGDASPIAELAALRLRHDNFAEETMLRFDARQGRFNLEGSMMTRREMLLASIACAASPESFATSDQAAVIGSTVFDWEAIPSRPTESGSVRSFCKSRTATLEELEIHATTLEPGKSPHPPHRHPNEELVIVWRGTLDALENGEWKRVGPGSVIFSASNQLHGLRNPGNEPAVYHVVNWKSASTPQESRS